MPTENSVITREHLPGLLLARTIWENGGPSLYFPPALQDATDQARAALPAPASVPDGYMPIPTAEQLADALENVRCFHDMSAELIAPRLLANLLAVTTVKAEQVGMADAYVGAREDLAIWKRRALEAEQKIRHQEQIIDQLTLEDQGETRFGEPSLPAAGSAELPEPDFTLDGGSQPCYYAETVQRIVAALSAQQSATERVSVPKLAGLQSVNHQLGIVALSFKNSEQTQEAVRELRARLASHAEGGKV